ncbi:hypothetical protein D3C83_103880 [compost metagenome]
MTFRATARPRPVPLLCFVEKNRSKTFSRASGGMPAPVSETRNWIPCPSGAAATLRVTVPPPGVASTPFEARLTRHRSIARTSIHQGVAFG